jgi:hypothetical protein
MERYDYKTAVYNDVKNALDNGDYEDTVYNYLYDEDGNKVALDEIDRDSLYNDLYDSMFISDSITGNASGSYTFNTWESEENLTHNLDLLAEAVECFGGSVDVLKDGAEACDVTIRCYLLAEALQTVLDENFEEV